MSTNQNIRDWQVQTVAAGMLGTRLMRETARRLVERRFGRDQPLDDRLAAVAAVFAAAHQSMSMQSLADTDTLRESLIDVIVTAWQAAIDLGLASDIPLPEPPEPPLEPVRHDALDLIFTVIQIRGWEPRLLDDRVVFVDEEGRTCVATVSVVFDHEDEDENEDQEQDENNDEDEDDDQIDSSVGAR